MGLPLIGCRFRKKGRSAPFFVSILLKKNKENRNCEPRQGRGSPMQVLALVPTCPGIASPAPRVRKFDFIFNQIRNREGVARGGLRTRAHPCRSFSSLRGASQMRRGNPFADGLPHLRSQWIALSLTLRAMTIRRECLSPCRPRRRLPRRITSASQVRFYVLISIYYRNHEERSDVVIPCKYWHPCRPVPGLLHPLARVRKFESDIISSERGTDRNPSPFLPV